MKSAIKKGSSFIFKLLFLTIIILLAFILFAGGSNQNFENIFSFEGIFSGITDSLTGASIYQQQITGAAVGESITLSSIIQEVKELVMNYYLYLTAFALFLLLLILTTIIHHHHKNKPIKVPLPPVSRTFLTSPPLKRNGAKKEQQLTENIESVNNNLSLLREEVKIKSRPRPCIISTLPPTPGYGTPMREETLQKEQKKISSILLEVAARPFKFLGYFVPKPKPPEELLAEDKAALEVERIARKIEGAHPVPPNELLMIERELAKIRKELGE